MLEFSTYDLATGRITGNWEVPDMDAAMANIDPGTEGTIEGRWDSGLGRAATISGPACSAGTNGG